jgi:hypothetical protein
MNKTLAEPSWGARIIEDTDTGSLSLQCICGGIGMYYRRIILTAEEANAFRQGRLDLDQLVRDVCKETPRVAGRIVPSFREDELD